MRRFAAVLQAAVLMTAPLIIVGTPTYAAPDCQVVAEAMRTMESELAVAWEAKKAGGREELARVHSASVHDAFMSMPRSWSRCLNADGKMRHALLVSKTNLLMAELDQTTQSKSESIALQRTIIEFVRPYRAANLIYWQAINDDLAKIRRRFDVIAQAQAQAADAKRQAVLNVTHRHDSGEMAKRLAGIDTKSTKSHPQPQSSKVVQASSSPSCDRPNVAATTLHPVEPDTPPAAQQQGISGTVQVVVSLNATSEVIAAHVQTSPSAVLNDAAFAAARRSTFQTEIRNCKPIAADYIYSVEFNSQ